MILLVVQTDTKQDYLTENKFQSYIHFVNFCILSLAFQDEKETLRIFGMFLGDVLVNRQHPIFGISSFKK